MAAPQLSWADVHAGLARAGKKMGQWAGLPLAIEGMRMVVHPSYPFAENLSKTFMPKPSLRVCRNEDVNEECVIRNEWRSYRDGRGLTIWQEGKRFRFSYSARQHTGTMLIQTLGVARAWDMAAELRAMEKLRSLVTQWAFDAYFLTGSFLETSPRSGVIYLFRRLRPTLAMSGRPDRKGRDVGVRILCALCAHPIGYYEDSWAGALVPTDDVIAHLLMMRSDEHYMWRMCNQHPPLAPEAGL